MGINSTSFTTVTVENMQKAILGLVSSPPDLQAQNDPPRTPGELIGYYNPATDKVQLYAASPGGNFWLEVG